MRNIGEMWTYLIESWGEFKTVTKEIDTPQYIQT